MLSHPTLPRVSASKCDAAVRAKRQAPREIPDLSAITLRSHPNVLVIGDASEAEDALAQLRPGLHSPIVSWLPREAATIPATPYQTLLIWNTERLTATQQADLLAAIEDTQGNVQLISLAHAPLYPAVESGTFLEGLYYRLNVVMVDYGADQQHA